MGYPTQQQKVDYLFKKIGFTKTKTGVAEDQTSGFSGDTKKAPPNEAIASPLIIPSSSVWSDSSFITATPPTSNTAYVGVYTTATAYRMTVDTTVANERTFIARQTWGNPSSAIEGDWIDTQFGADYLIKVYKNDPSVGVAGVDYFNLSAAGTTGKDDVWFFDYSSGVLNFNGEDLDGQLSGITTSNIYIVGYRYIGRKGIQPAAGIGTFHDLVVSNNLSVGGISTFGGLIDANGIIEGIAGQNKIPSLYANYSDLPSAGTYHGMFAHVHATARGYFAHAGGWFELVNKEVTGVVGTGTETYHIGNLNVTGITTLGSIGISTGIITGPAVTYIDPATVGDDTGTLVVKGNLQVEGTQTTVNSSTMTVTDKNIELAKGAANDAAADGGGITIDSGGGDKTWQWLDATDSWTSSEHIRIPDDKVFGFASDTNSYIGRPAADKIAFTLGGTERVRITTTGVGINTDPNTYNSSTYQFVVKTHNNANAGITLHSSSSGTGGVLFTDSGGNSAQGQIRYDHSTNHLKFTANAYERMHITANGALGIGTNNAENLDSTAHDLVIGKGQASVDAGLTIFTGTDAEGKIFFADSVSGNGQRRGKIIYDHTGNSMQFATNATERLRITTDGYLQLNNADSRIYTSANTSILRFGGGSSTSVSNGATLSLTGRTYSGGNYADLASATGGHIRFRIGTSEKVRIDTDGHVTIGVGASSLYNTYLTIPRYTVDGDAAKFISLRNDAAPADVTFVKSRSTTYGSYAATQDDDIIMSINSDIDTGSALSFRGTFRSIYDSATGGVHFMWGSGGAPSTTGEKMRLTSTGNVGIGSVIPAAKLDVNGTSQFQDDVSVGGNLTISGISTHSEGIFVPDDKSIRVGGTFANPDLKIHSSSTYDQAVIDYNRSGTGRALRIRATNLQIENWNGLTPTVKVIGGAGVGHVELNYAGSKKFETTSSGVGIAGSVTVSNDLDVTGITTTGTFNTGNATFTGTISAGSTTGTNGYYLKTTGIGVTWAAFPSSRTTSTQTATAGQTTFNFSYNVGYVDVFLNGVKLPESEFVASNGSTIVLDDAAFANDTLEFVSYNTVPNSSAGAQNLTGLADITITGTPVIGETLQHNGSVFVNDFTVSTTTTSTSQTAISSLPIATYRSVEYTIQVTEGTKYHVTKVLAIHDGTNVSFNEYGTLTTSTSLSTFALDINSGNMRLLATPASTNSTVFKVKFTGIKV